MRDTIKRDVCNCVVSLAKPESRLFIVDGKLRLGLNEGKRVVPHVLFSGHSRGALRPGRIEVHHEEERWPTELQRHQEESAVCGR